MDGKVVVGKKSRHSLVSKTFMEAQSYKSKVGEAEKCTSSAWMTSSSSLRRRRLWDSFWISALYCFWLASILESAKSNDWNFGLHSASTKTNAKRFHSWQFSTECRRSSFLDAKAWPNFRKVDKLGRTELDKYLNLGATNVETKRFCKLGGYHPSDKGLLSHEARLFRESSTFNFQLVCFDCDQGSCVKMSYLGCFTCFWNFSEILFFLAFC